MLFKKEIVTNGRVIILDQPLSGEARAELERLETIDGHELFFLEDRGLACDLEEILETVDQHNTLFVFPGNGSNFPRKLSQVCKEVTGTGVLAKRYWVPGEDPEAQVGLIYPEQFILLGVKNVVVVDDVISSGLTMRRIFQKNAWRIPGATWQACSWISQVLPCRGIRGYEGVLTACLVRRAKGTQKVPINSLSTLRNNTQIADSYAHRHFKKSWKFLHLIKKQPG